MSTSSLLSNSAALSSLSSSSAASASNHFSRKSSRRFPWAVLPAVPGALGRVVRSESSPDGGGSVKSKARNSRVCKQLKVASDEIQTIFPYFQDTVPVTQSNTPISVTTTKRSIHKNSDGERTYMSDKINQWHSSAGEMHSRFGNSMSATTRLRGNNKYLDATSNNSSAWNSFSII
jgi:hypothetical protein